MVSLRPLQWLIAATLAAILIYLLLSTKFSQSAADSDTTSTAPPISTPDKPLELEVRWQIATQIIKTEILPFLPSERVPNGKKYRTCMLSVTRNEHHMTEFLLRNLLAGVEHFWLFDDNRIFDNMDMNITVLVEPFRRLGLLDIIRSPHKGKETMKESDKVSYMRLWREKATPLCHWASVTDSDEIWYPLDPKYKDILSKMVILDTTNSSEYSASDDLSGVGNLYDTLERLDAEYNAEYYKPQSQSQTKTSLFNHFRFGWLETDNEMRILRGTSSLMNDYPRVCHYNWNMKWWVRMDHPIDSLSDHLIKFIGQKPNPKDFRNSENIWIFHYQMKSVEEYIVKVEQAFDRWPRSLAVGRRKCNSLARNSGYDLSKAVGRSNKIPYATKYQNIVNSVFQKWPLHPNDAYMSSLGGITISFEGHPHWELYIFMKWAVASNFIWNDKLYLQTNNITLVTHDDGLHHFLNVGFYNHTQGCFSNQRGDSFCTRPNNVKKP